MRSPIIPFPKARYSSAFSVKIFLKILFPYKFRLRSDDWFLATGHIFIKDFLQRFLAKQPPKKHPSNIRWSDDPMIKRRGQWHHSFCIRPRPTPVNRSSCLCDAPLTFNSFNTVLLDSSSSFWKALLLVTPVISIIICQTWSSGNSHNRCSSFHKEARYHPYACASDQEYW